MTQNQELDVLDCHGLFVLAISTLESMMNDIAVYLLQAVPQKLDSKEFKLTKEELTNSFLTFGIVENQSQKEVTAAAYKNIEQFLEYFCKVTSISNNAFSQEKINEWMANSLYFGNFSVGLGTASQYYFGSIFYHYVLWQTLDLLLSQIRYFLLRKVYY